MLHSNALNEGLLNKLFKLGRELGPVTRDLLAKQHGGQLSDVGGLGGAQMLNQGRNHLRVLSQPLNLVLRLTPGIVVGHQELNEQ